MSEHTKGPWEIHDGGRFGQWGDMGPSICAKTGEHRCQPLFDLSGPADIEQCKANCRLVAAAPDLLMACEMLEDDPGITSGANDVIKYALAKYRGEVDAF